MKRIQIEIELENEAFTGAAGWEVARICEGLMKKLRPQRRLLEGDYGRLIDVNGNKVGKWEIKE